MTTMATTHPSRTRAGAVVALFVLALVVSVVRPMLSSRDIAKEKLVDAVTAHASDLPRGGRVLVHPPWRQDAVDTIRAAGIFSRETSVTVALTVKHGEPPPPMLVVADAAHPLSAMLLKSTRVISEKDGVVVRATDPSRRSEAFDLSTRLFEARVSVEKSDGSAVQCRFQAAAEKHDCSPLPSWNRVARETVTSGGTSRACIWAHPISGGTVKVALGDVRATGPLTFGHAIADSGLRSPNAQPVTASVLVDGVEKMRAARDNKPGFATRDVHWPDDGAPHTLEVRITTADDGARHYCFFIEQAERAR
jgi:hypothetical protein